MTDKEALKAEYAKRDLQSGEAREKFLDALTRAPEARRAYVQFQLAEGRRLEALRDLAQSCDATASLTLNEDV